MTKENKNTYLNCFDLLSELYANQKISAEAYVRLDSAFKDMYTAGYNEGENDERLYGRRF